MGSKNRIFPSDNHLVAICEGGGATSGLITVHVESSIDLVDPEYTAFDAGYPALPALHLQTIPVIIDVMTNQELETVVTYVKDRLPEPATQAPITIPNDYFRLTERIIRVEEGLLRVEEAIKNQNLLMEKRFEDLIHQMDKRFEAMDKRFEDMIHQMDKRFEAMDKRFEAIDKRFEDMIHLMDKRFEDMNTRFDAIGRRFNWTIGITTALITGLGVLITIYRFLGPIAAG